MGERHFPELEGYAQRFRQNACEISAPNRYVICVLRVYRLQGVIDIEGMHCGTCDVQDVSGYCAGGI